MNLIVMFSKYVDKFGMVGNFIPKTGQIEVGDSCQRMGMIYAYENWTGKQVLHYRNDEHLANELLTPPRRHPDHSKWPGQAGTLSRDNATPMIVANEHYAKKIFWKLLFRFGFFWNVKDLEGKVKKLPIPDILSPKVFGALIRSTGWWWLYPLLFATDLFLLLSAIFRVVYIKINPTHTSDELNIQVLLHQGVRAFQTPISRLAFWAYFKWADKTALRRYFRLRKDLEPPPIFVLYEELWGKRK